MQFKQLGLLIGIPGHGRKRVLAIVVKSRQGPAEIFVILLALDAAAFNPVRHIVGPAIMRDPILA